MRRRYAAGVIIVGAAAYISLARRWQLRWGSTDREIGLRLPGDQLIEIADLTATRGITIRAAADRVWPWIVQLGQGRGGFYSYDFLENLVGCDIHSSDRIVPEWQEARVGDKVGLAPNVGLDVVELVPGSALVLRGAVPVGHSPPPYDFTWAFVLRDDPEDGTTRLLVRERYAWMRPWVRLLVEPVAAVSFVMSQKMLRGVRDRAQRAS